jgi:hypothetical protein
MPNARKVIHSRLYWNGPYVGHWVVELECGHSLIACADALEPPSFVACQECSTKEMNETANHSRASK